MILAITGHRPEKAIEAAVRSEYRRTFEEVRPSAVICGMASGVDLWAGTEAVRAGFPVWAAKPWKGHKPRKADAELYAEVIEAASRIVNVNESETYLGPWLYQARNEWMVDNATHVLAFWDGSPGGTKNCVDYCAPSRGDKPVRNLWVPF